jgi:hypothetical protein
MLPGGKAAVICNGGVISGAGPPAFARAGRAGGAHSRGAVAGRGQPQRPQTQFGGYRTSSGAQRKLQRVTEGQRLLVPDRRIRGRGGELQMA